MKTTRISFVALALAVSVPACDEAPTTPTPTGIDAAAVQIEFPHGATSGLTHSAAPFRNWKHGFDHGTEGWYGKDQAGELGWCGTVEAEQRTPGPGSVAPSAGRGYAVVQQDVCNATWEAVYSSPGATLVGVPWAPGPAFAAMGSPMPASGYVVELDVYLDPDRYEAVPPEPGTWVFEFPSWKGAVIGYSVSFMTLGDGALHYLWFPVMEGDGSLVVDGYEVTEAGWYTFRVLFGDDTGALSVVFELADSRGGTLFTKAKQKTFYTGEGLGTFASSDVATGYAWFTSLSTGLALPIDEYRVRPGG